YYFEFLITPSTFYLKSSGENRELDTKNIIDEINEFIHLRLDKEWIAKEWKKMELGVNLENVHPLVRVAFNAHIQINEFIESNKGGVSLEIFELSEIAIKVNMLYKKSAVGLYGRLKNLCSYDFHLYNSARYEIQIAGMLAERGHEVEFVEEGIDKKPDILVKKGCDICELECKHKDQGVDQLNYINSIYNNIQRARKQFTKNYPAIIMIEIDKKCFDEFLDEIGELKEEIDRAMRNSQTISAIIITSKLMFETEDELHYTHRVFPFLNQNSRYHIPEWLANNLIFIRDD
ncbi:MAG: hypothetical protein JW860_14420, partial [Sedimentisphaerales bacterium]|nr:hypothetical protein [Sedimentisphaerales bacterium]